MNAEKLLSFLATLKVGGEPADQCRWLVAFGNWDGEPLTRTDWRGLKTELNTFVWASTWKGPTRGLATPVTVPMVSGWPRKVSQQQVRDGHQGVRRVLTQVARGARDPDWHDDWASVGAVRLLTRRAISDGRPVVYVKGLFADVLTLTAFFHLTQGDVAPVRRCQECGTFFVRSGRQKFCLDDTRCAREKRKKYWAGYAASPEGQQARRRQLDALRVQRARKRTT